MQQKRQLARWYPEYDRSQGIQVHGNTLNVVGIAWLYGKDRKTLYSLAFEYFGPSLTVERAASAT